MDPRQNLKLTDVRKARLFTGAISREEAGLLPICDADNDLTALPPLRGVELRQFWADVWDYHGNTLGNSKRDRTIAAWRVMRQVGIMRGVIQPDDPLETSARNVQLESSEFTSFAEVSHRSLRNVLSHGVAMVPPDVPKAYLLADGTVAETYEPSHQGTLVRFTKMVEVVVQMLKLRENDLTKRGVQWLVNPDTVRAGWPSLSEIVELETDIVYEMVELLSEESAREARKRIAAEWQLPPVEVEQVCALAMRAMALRQRLQDRDGNKALVMAQLDAIYEKAIDALDYRGAAMIQRERWRIFRDRGEEDVADDFEEMTNVISTSASEKRRSTPRLEG